MSRPPLVLSIQSEVVWGHVGNGVARFALQRLGCNVLALPTVLLAHHPGHGAPRGAVQSVEGLADLAKGLEDRGLFAQVDGIITGYFGAAEQTTVARRIVLAVKAANPKALYLCDPVIGDEGGAYVRPGVAEGLARDLLPLADIVTPNRFEAQSLTARSVRDVSDAVLATAALGKREAIVSSVPHANGQIGTVMHWSGGASGTFSDRIAKVPFGSGDLLAALYLGRRLLGADPAQALSLAASAVDAILRASDGQPEMALIAHQSSLTGPDRLLDLVPL